MRERRLVGVHAAVSSAISLALTGIIVVGCVSDYRRVGHIHLPVVLILLDISFVLVAAITVRAWWRG